MSLLNHTMGIITKPKAEWELIKAEPTSAAQLFTGFVCILALIPAIAGFIGYSIIGISVPNPFGPSFYFKFPISAGIIYAASSYVLGLIGVYVAALVVNALAKSFESTPNQENALKLVAYSYTPSWLVGIFVIYSPLSFLSILGIYSLFVFYFGLEPMMNTPKSKKVVYMIVSAIVILVVMVIIGLVVGIVTPKPTLESMLNQMNFDLK